MSSSDEEFSLPSASRPLQRRGAIKRKEKGQSNRGRKKSRPDVEHKKLYIQLYVDELERFHQLCGILRCNNRETLIYLMDCEKAYSEVTVSEDPPTSSTPTKRPTTAVDDGTSSSTRFSDYAGRRQEQWDRQDEGTADDFQQPPVVHRRPVYANAALPMPAPIPEEEDIDECNPGPDVFEFRPPEEECGDDPAEMVDAIRYGEIASYFQQSLDASDHHGELLGSSSAATPVDPAELAKAKESDPRNYDYSDGLRLLPDGYYKSFSDGLQCRLHVSKETPDNDAAGFLRDPSKVRREQSSYEIAQSKRYIVELGELLKLISPKCYRSDCIELNDFSEQGLQIRRYGAVCIISILCKGPLRHRKVWCSSRRLQHRSKERSIFYAINTLLPSAILLSGNHFQKIDLFFKVLNLRGISKSQFYDIQRCVVAPAVFDAYDRTQTMIADTLKQRDLQVILGCDAQFDSPGKCANICTITSMIVSIVSRSPEGVEKIEPTAYVAAVEVLESRHTDLRSVRMEHAGFFRSLMQTSVHMGLDIRCVVTDQNLTLVKLMQLAKTNPDAFTLATQDLLRHFDDAKERDFHVLLCMICAEIEHQLDVWHRAKNIGKALMKLSVPKAERENYYKWIQSIKNHFFWCSQNCNGEEMKFRASWMSILHHCCDEHEWPLGRCDHEIPYDRRSDQPEYLSPESKSIANIRCVITDPKLLADIPRYLKFRHTSSIESFNSMCLTYKPKRIGLTWVGSLVRTMIAVLDWNNAVHLPILRDDNNQPIYGVRYHKRAKHRIARPVKAENRRDHLPHLMARCLYERATTDVVFYTNGFSYDLQLPNDPRKLAKNTGKTHESREEVIAHHRRMTRMGCDIIQPHQLGLDCQEDYLPTSEDEELESDDDASEEFL